MMGCAKYWYSWDADNTDERRLTQTLLIISKINLRTSVLSASSASSDIKLTHLVFLLLSNRGNPKCVQQIAVDRFVVLDSF